MHLTPDHAYEPRCAFPDVDRACADWLAENDPDEIRLRNAREAGNLRLVSRLLARREHKYLEGFETEPSLDEDEEEFAFN